MSLRQIPNINNNDHETASIIATDFYRQNTSMVFDYILWTQTKRRRIAIETWIVFTGAITI